MGVGRPHVQHAGPLRFRAVRSVPQPIVCNGRIRSGPVARRNSRQLHVVEVTVRSQDIHTAATTPTYIIAN